MWENEREREREREEKRKDGHEEGEMVVARSPMHGISFSADGSVDDIMREYLIDDTPKRPD
jgi:hypothetical protein